jgi:RNA polymerase sigma factor (sigma-70 family)
MPKSFSFDERAELMSPGRASFYAFERFRKDEELVRECLLGKEDAWSELVEKYKNLIFSIPIKQGFSSDDAGEIFQAVSFTVLQELVNLRDPRALAAWLITLTSRKCIRWRRERNMVINVAIEEENFAETTNLPEKLIHEVEQEQMLRTAIGELSPDCARLIELLFFTIPSVSYDDAARALGFAKGSIGATRMRCLDKLRLSLEKKGFR